jgi:hypothetical protein
MCAALLNIRMGFTPLFDTLISKALHGLFTIRKTGILDVRIEIVHAAMLASYFYVILPKLNKHAAMQAFKFLYVLKFKKSRVHAGAF